MIQESTRIQLINNPLEYRSSLTLPRNVNFGVEIELENVDFDKVYHLVRRHLGTSWKVKPDKSLLCGDNAEIASPVMKNETKYWMLLKKLAELLSKFNPTFDNCSFQVNFDGSMLPTEDDKIRFLKLYAFYEDILYRFSKGEDKKYRMSLDIYASPIILSLKDALSTGDKDYVLERFSDNKRYGIVFKTEVKDLIEFRTPNSTINPVLWQNYITLFYYLLSFINSNKYNKKEIDEYIESYSELNILKSYEELREDKVISLSKKIFSNQRDRVFFLHQYFGK